MAVKKTKKVEKPVESTKPLVKRLDQGEMRKLEEKHHEMIQAKTKMSLQEQYIANLILKKENFQMEIKLLDSEITRARAIQKSEQDRYDNSVEKLQIIGNELKLKYNLKSPDGIKYDNLSGELIDN
jgi:hypothetical protein